MEDTIAAIATAFGEGGIGIVRISGEEAGRILRDIFVPVRRRRGKGSVDGNCFLPDQIGETIGLPIENRRLTYGRVIDPKNGSLIDEALAVFMKSPYTYTMEDVAEIHCHGSLVSLRRTLSLCLENGARLAEPGEFTKRAFLNGRLDLSQAEAVIDVIKAKADKTFDVALGQMEGKLSGEIRCIRNDIMDILVDIAVNLDYPDEDIEEITYEKLKKSLSLVYDALKKLMDSAATGRMLREGLDVVIAGKPNVGKSSLMNAFLRESRAIVTDIPGTTRDTIQEAVSLSGIPIKLTDTAGIRETSDQIELIGMERSKRALSEADLVLFMLSGNESATKEDMDIIPYLDPSRTIVLLNKSDLGDGLKSETILEKLPQVEVLRISVKEGKGMDVLEEKIKDVVYRGQVSQTASVIVTNVRHEALIRKAAESIRSAVDMVERGEALDFLEIDIRQAFDYLGEIIGETADDEIINQVFSRFCLGK